MEYEIGDIECSGINEISGIANSQSQILNADSFIFFSNETHQH